MVDGDRLFRSARRIEAGFLATVGKIDHDVVAVESLHHLVSQGSEPTVPGRHRAIAQQVRRVVGELNDAHAEVGEDIDAFRLGAQHRRVLEAVDHADLVLASGEQNIRGVVDLQQAAGILTQQRVPLPDLGDRVFERLQASGHVA